MHKFIIPVQQYFMDNANSEKTLSMKKYMKNQFDYFGLIMPFRRKFCTEYIRKNPLTSIIEIENIVKELWQYPQREYQYFAIELLAFYKKLWNVDTIKIINEIIITKSWWDSVDFISSYLCSPYFKKFPEQIQLITFNWNRSENFWLRRSSLLFQLKYKKETDTKILTNYIQNLILSKEFFIRKAIGWVLREYSKTNPDWVVAFVCQHQQLSGLSKREALKVISKKEN